MNDLLSIGQFAKLCETTTDTLIHYDNLNILTPAKISETNRRLYKTSQYYRFCAIQTFADAGMPLNTIKKAFESESVDLLLDSLKETEHTLKQKLFHLQNTIMYIDDLQILSSVIHEDDIQTQPMIYMQTKPQNMFATLVHEHPSSSKEFMNMLKTHTDACKNNSVYPFPIGYVIKKENPWHKNDKSFLLTSPLRTGMSDNRTLVQPAGQYAFILHKGSLDSITNSIQLLKQYIGNHSFRILSDTYITVYNNYLLMKQDEMYLIKILIEPI